MPIIRHSDQKIKTLEECYQRLLIEEAGIVVNRIGQDMLTFISMVNHTFINTTLYGLTSHYSLSIQPTDNWEDGWFLSVHSNGDHTWEFEYKMPDDVSPWTHAIVKGQANTIEEAKEYLLIAMIESKGWEDNKELKKLYNKLKQREAIPKFSLWLEFEEVDPGNWNIENEFCNVIVDLKDGRRYGLNVWTYQYVATAVKLDTESGNNLSGLYQKPPDLLVKELTRPCIEQTIRDLLKTDELEKVLNPGILHKRKPQ